MAGSNDALRGCRNALRCRPRRPLTGVAHSPSGLAEEV